MIVHLDKPSFLRINGYAKPGQLVCDAGEICGVYMGDIETPQGLKAQIEIDDTCVRS